MSYGLLFSKFIVQKIQNDRQTNKFRIILINYPLIQKLCKWFGVDRIFSFSYSMILLTFGKFWKSQNFSFSYMTQKWIRNHLRSLKNLRKSFFNVLEVKLDKKLILDKIRHTFFSKIQKLQIFWKFLIWFSRRRWLLVDQTLFETSSPNFFVTWNVFFCQNQKYTNLNLEKHTVEMWKCFLQHA
jgi:hypothetical protein